MFGFNVCMHVLRRYVHTYACMFVCALVTEKLLNRFPTLQISIDSYPPWDCCKLFILNIVLILKEAK